MDNQEPTEGEILDSSPLPQKTDEATVITLDFPNAMQAIIDGKKITKLEWNNPEIIALMREGYLEIFMDNQFQTWTIRDADLLGEDYIIVQESN